MEAMKETERILADPKTKYYTDVEKVLMESKNSAIVSSWDELEKELFTPEEIAASERRVARTLHRLKVRQRKARKAKAR